MVGPHETQGWTGRFGRLLGDRAGAHLAHRLGKGYEIVDRGFWRLGGGRRQPHHLPALGCGETGRMLGAQVIGVRFGVRGQRTEDDDRVAVVVGERRDSGL